MKQNFKILLSFFAISILSIDIKSSSPANMAPIRPIAPIAPINDDYEPFRVEGLTRDQILERTRHPRFDLARDLTADQIKMLTPEEITNLRPANFPYSSKDRSFMGDQRQAIKDVLDTKNDSEKRQLFNERQNLLARLRRTQDEILGLLARRNVNREVEAPRGE